MSSIGLAMIVRNGAATLGACLDSVQGLFDQTVVVDTGSTDNSVEIALAHGAESHRFDWVDDFSVARNYSFDQLKTEWAFWLDADDILVGGEYLLELLDKCQTWNLDGVILEYLYSFSEEGRPQLEQEWIPQWQRRELSAEALLTLAQTVCNTTQYRERLVRNDPAWRWTYPIHEALPAAGKRLGKFEKMKVLHRRHIRPGLATQGRNLSYLLKYPVEKRDERIWFYFGLEYGHAGKYEESIQAFLTYLPLSTVPDEQYLAYCFLGDLHRFVAKPEESIPYFLRALGMRPTWRTAYIGLLETYTELRRWSEAIYYGAQIERAEMPDTPFAYNPLHHAVSWVNHYVLALVEVQQHEEAMAVLARARERAPHDPMFRFNEDSVAVMLNQFHGIQSMADTLEYLVRTDHCEVAALLLGRLGPEFRAHPGIRRSVERVGSICGPAARGDVVADTMKIDPDLEKPGLSVFDRWWLDPRMTALKREVALTPGLSSALLVGVPEPAVRLLSDLGVTTLVQLAALPRWGEAAAHGPFQLAVLWSALERVRDPGQLVAQARQMLVPDGKLVASVSNGPATKGVGIPPVPRLRAYSVDDFRQVMGTVQMPTVLKGWPADAGDLWLTVPLPILPGRPRSIAIVCPLSPEPWGPYSLNQGIGGSEEAVIRLSRAFARRGHTVTVYGSGWEGSESVQAPSGATISYQPISRYHPADILLGWRYPEIFTGARPFEAEWKALWMHDSLARERVESCVPVVDAIWAISQYHAGLYHGIPKLYEGRNGIDPWEFEQAEADVEGKDPHRCVFISTAFRGLDGLLAMWPEIVRRVPTASLHCYYGWEAADRMGVTAPGSQGAAFKAHVMAEIERLGVHWHGRVGQDVLYREVLRAGVWTYPSTWNEEHCIAAYVAQSAGAWPVVVPRGALAQSVVFGQKVEPEHFVDATVEAMHAEEGRQRMANWVRQWCSWDEVACQWERLWRGLT